MLVLTLADIASLQRLAMPVAVLVCGVPLQPITSCTAQNQVRWFTVEGRFSPCWDNEFASLFERIHDGYQPHM